MKIEYRDSSEMIDSGVEWIGKIPKGWKIERCQGMSTISSGIPVSNEVEAFEIGMTPFVRVSDLSTNKGRFIFKTRDGSFGIKSKTYPKGTIVFPKSGESIKKNERKILSEKSYVVGHLACIIPQKNKLFLDFAYWKTMAWDFNNSLIQTAMPSLNLSEISKKEIALPSYVEQKKIANFLNSEFSSLEKQIYLTLRKISLLEEKKKSLIYEAVTGKLDVGFGAIPYGDNGGTRESMDSGVEWIGDIPKGWRILRLKDLANIKTGDSLSSSLIDSEKNAICKYLVYGSNGKRGFSSLYNNSGDFWLVGRQGSAGEVNFASGNFWATEHALILNSNAGVSNNFLGFLLMAIPLKSYVSGVAQPGISIDVLGKIKVLLPNLLEQQVLCNFLTQTIKGLEHSSTLLRTKISLLEEKKKSLIYEAVTGKIKIT